jgi:protein LTV1
MGEASLYGVYYDDTEYDYMQHLRDPNVEEEGVETIMIEAPTVATGKAKEKGKGKGKAREDLQLRLPPEALPSSSEMDRSQAYDAQQAVPDAIAGFQPDMDPHLRQVLEALEEDAFVEDDLDEGFFGELVGDGERSGDEDPGYEFREEGIGEGEEPVQGGAAEEGGEGGEREESWEVRFARFKTQQKDAPGEVDASEVDGFSESADTVGRLPVMGGKKRRRGAATASSGFSMTSSAIYRNGGLSTLDERYDQVSRPFLI